MKKIYLILLIISGMFLMSCISIKSLEGDWETVALIKEGENQNVVTSNIKFINKDKYFKAKGCAGVNLYNSKVKVKGKSFSASEMENTGLYGIPEEMDFEGKFFDVFMNSDSYKIVDDILYIYSSSKKMELQLKRKETES